MLYKLSLKNIKKSFKDYAIYFFTLILGISIFYIFNSLESQTVMMQVSSNTREVIKLMNNVLSAVSVFVSFILGFLIIYASRFLIKRRSKEFGIYLTLGMSKRKVSTLLLVETIIIGLISLVFGLLLGVSLSQVMSLVVANMFEADLTNFTFVFSASACVKTIIYFGIIYVTLMIFNVLSISKCKLIDLIRNGKKQEQVKLKNPVLSTIVFVLSVIDLGIAYYLVTGGIEILDNVSYIFIPIAMGIFGTFFLFWSLSGLIIRILTKMKSVYFKGLNSFTVKQISSRVNTTVMSMTIICLMLFVTICVLSSALSLKNSITANLKTLVPMDIEFSKQLNVGGDVNDPIVLDSNISIKETLDKLDFDYDSNLRDIIEFDVYVSSDVTLKDSLGNYYSEVSKMYPLLSYYDAEMFVKESDYNKVADAFGVKRVSLKDDEYAIVANYDEIVDIRNEALKLGTSISLFGKSYKPRYDECVDGFIYMSANHSNTGIFVVPDDALDDSIREVSILLANYKGETKEEKRMLEDVIDSLNNHSYITSTTIDARTKISIYESSVGLGAMAAFIGLYLGIIFMISSAAILALKELSESTDNKERYKILRSLGADEKIINKSLFRQIGVFFLFPLVIAVIHSVFGIMFCNFILETIGNEKLLISIIMTALFLVIIYGGYFVITYLCSKNIIKE